jgi:hypothetical protein
MTLERRIFVPIVMACDSPSCHWPSVDVSGLIRERMNHETVRLPPQLKVPTADLARKMFVRQPEHNVIGGMTIHFRQSTDRDDGLIQLEDSFTCFLNTNQYGPLQEFGPR